MIFCDRRELRKVFPINDDEWRVRFYSVARGHGFLTSAVLVLAALFAIGSAVSPAIAEELEPDYPFYYPREQQRVFHFLLSDWPEEAVRLASDFLAKYPDDAESYYILAIGRAQLGDLDGGADAMARALERGMSPSRFLAGPRALVAPLAAHPSFKALQAQQNGKPVHGPTVGALTDLSVKVWVRTDGPAEVGVRLWPVNDEQGVVTATPVRTTASRDYTAVVSVTGLKPDTEFAYETLIDGAVTRAPNQRIRTLSAGKDPGHFSVVFGGCAGYQPEYERIWDVILKQNPRAVLTLGDNIYSDDAWRLDMQRFCYYQRQSRPEWRRLVSQIPIYSIWDDHDVNLPDGWGGPQDMRVTWYNHDRQAGAFGPNFGYFKEMASLKTGVLKVFEQNWVNPGYGDAAPWGGCWHRFAIGDVDFFMLDCRYYRTDPRGEHPTMLGPRQKAWLKEGLRTSDKAFKVIAASVPWEFETKDDSLDTWNGFPDEREELFSLLESERIGGVVLLSCDRHRSDAYRIPRPNGYDLYDLMSAHFTKPAKNSHPTIDHALFSYNKRPAFGLMTFETAGAAPSVRYQIVNIDNESVYSLEIPLADLQQPR